MPIIIILTVLTLSTSIQASSSQFTCNLLSISSDQVICDLPLDPQSSYKLADQSSSYLFFIQGQSRLIWSNKLEPANTRWSQLCPSAAHSVAGLRQPSSQFVCSNSRDCDRTGHCIIKLVDASQRGGQLSVHLIDNVNETGSEDDTRPKFTDDLKLINITFDLLESAEADRVLIESTEPLDHWHSRLVRARNTFKLELLEKNAAEIDPFEVHYDSNNEKLFLWLNPSYLELLKSNRSLATFFYKLSVKRPHSLDDNGDDFARVQINLKDTRYDRPVFDSAVYNFTVTENSPLNTIIGRVSAIYLNAADPSLIKYRIVPFIDEKSFDMMPATASGEESSLTGHLPIRIEASSGVLVQKVLIDREKHMSEHHQKAELAGLGLISFNVEASYASTLYDYCKVNVFIKDVNDNAPIARIKPMNSFDRAQKNSPIFSNINNNNASAPTATINLSSIASNLYINDRTANNQILAYISVLDQDAGENGTVKSIELALSNYKLPSQHTLRQRMYKLEQLREFERLANRTASSSLLSAPETVNLQQQQPPQLPVRLNRISNKLYTFQLIQRLSFQLCEAYSIEMRIQDNGTRPQLETKSRINLNILDNNQFAPVFLNLHSQVEIVENLEYNSAPIFRLNAVDLDDERNGQLRYRIVSNPFLGLASKTKQRDEKDLGIEALSLLDSTFSLNRESGELRLLRPLSRDALLNDTLELQVAAQDQTEPAQNRKQTLFTIYIRVIDLNNNMPKFESGHVDRRLLNIAFDFYRREEASSPPLAKFEKLTSDVFLVDLDTYSTNSAMFLDRFSNQTSHMLRQSNNNNNNDDNNDKGFVVSSLLDSRIFKFGEVECYKAFNIELHGGQTSSDLNTFPFLVYVHRELSDSKLNYVKCGVSLWLDRSKFAKSLNYSSSSSSVEGPFSYRLSLIANDNGVELDHSAAAATESNRLEISVQINVATSEAEQKPVIESKQFVSISLANRTTAAAVEPIELNSNGGELVELEMSACSQLIRGKDDSADASEFDLLKVSSLFRLFGNRLEFQAAANETLSPPPPPPEGIYLLEFYHINANMARRLIQLELVLHRSALSAQHSRNLVTEYQSRIASSLQNANNVYMSVRSSDLNGNSLMKTLQSSFSSTFSQFQSLLFGSSSSSNNDELLVAAPTGTTVFSVLFNSRSTFINFIVITMILSFIVLMLLACCILLVIRRNCVKSREEEKKISHKKNFNFNNNNASNGLNFQKRTNLFKNLNVIDDETAAKIEKGLIATVEDSDNGGFTRLIVQHGADDKYKQADSADKVTRYLSCLDTSGLQLYNSNSGSGSSSQMYFQAASSSQQNSRNSASENDESSEPNTSSPSSSLVTDSKKNLIVPVNYIEGELVQTNISANKPSMIMPSFVYNNNNNNISNIRGMLKKTGNSNKKANGAGGVGGVVKTSVCTLSTTSSSCISDEGCYGSSDFSSEHEKQEKIKQQKLMNEKQQQQQLILLNPSNIMKNQLIVSRTQTPILNTNNNVNLKNYQSYCLSRFEKIYNNTNSLVNTEAALVESESESPSSSSSNLSNSNNVQVITAISGSYV